MTLLLLAGVGLACLPHLLLGAVIIAVFLFGLWLVCTKLMPAPVGQYATWVIIAVLIIVLLYVLIQIYESGLAWVC